MINGWTIATRLTAFRPHNGCNSIKFLTTRSGSKTSHHDTHAFPPHFIQDAYKHYNTVKRAELDNDPFVIDFEKGLSQSQQSLFKRVGTISAQKISETCQRFSDSTMSPEPPLNEVDKPVQDAVIYEHQQFPGLQIVPGLLPPTTQVQFVSEIMHTCLANSQHKTNLQVEYELTHPDDLHNDDSQYSRRSLFTYKPLDTHAQPKDIKNKPLNMAQYLSSKLRWLTIGSQYDWPTRSYSGQDPTAFPPSLADLVSGFFPHIQSESGVCLLYGGKDFMPVHRDVSEQCEKALASFSFGCDGIFLVARGDRDIDDPDEQKKSIAVFRVHSGDCIHLTGEARWAWHAMARSLSNTCPRHFLEWPLHTGITSADERAFEKWKGFMISKRLNVSCRQVWD